MRTYVCRRKCRQRLCNANRRIGEKAYLANANALVQCYSMKVDIFKGNLIIFSCKKVYQCSHQMLVDIHIYMCVYIYLFILYVRSMFRSILSNAFYHNTTWIWSYILSRFSKVSFGNLHLVGTIAISERIVERFADLILQY